MTNAYAEDAADLSAAIAPTNRYAADASDLAGDQRTGLRAGVRSGAAATPEAAMLARRAGLPPDLVQRNLPEVKRDLAIDRVDTDTTNSPRLRERYADPGFAALAQDDSGALAKLDRTIGGVVSYVMGATPTGGVFGDLRAGYHRAQRGAAGTFRAISETAAIPLDFMERFPGIGGNPLRRLSEGFDQLAQQHGQAAERHSSQVQGTVAAGVSSGVQSLAQNTLLLPMALLPGGQAAALTGMAAQAGGDSYQKAREAGVGQLRALGYGASDAAIEIATERIPVHRLVGDVKAHASLVQTALRQAGAEIPGEQVATVLQDLNEWATLNPDKTLRDYTRERPEAALQTLIATLVGVGGNVAVLHGAQTAVDKVNADQAMADAKAALEAAARGELDSAAAAQVVRDAKAAVGRVVGDRATMEEDMQAHAAAAEGGADPVTVARAARTTISRFLAITAERNRAAFGEIASRVRDAAGRAAAIKGDIDQATNGAAALQQIVASADASALRARDPGAFADLVEHLHPEQRVYVAPEHLQGIDLSQVPAVAAQIPEAVATGGDVQLSLGDLLAHLPADRLLQHLRVQPAAMTLAEAEAFDLRGAAQAAIRGENPPPHDAPLLDAQQGTMSPADWQAYMQAADESAVAAIDQRDTRSLRDMQWLHNRKSEALGMLRREAEAVRQQIHETAAAEVRAMPVYAAQHALAQNPGIPADFVAEQHGFSSADSLRDAILQAPSESDAIDHLVEQRMSEQHPDLVDRVARERAAEAMIAGRARTRFLATEAAALSNALGSRDAMERKAASYARTSIAERQISNLRPAQFAAAAERAAKQAAAAFRRGETGAAAKAKRQQVLQEAMHAEAIAAVAEIEQDLQQFRRMLKPDDGTRDGNLANIARAILADYGLARVDKTAADYLAPVQNYDPELADDLRVLMEGLPTPARYRQLTVGEFRVVRERVEAVWTLARTSRQMEVDGQRIEIADAAAALADQLSAETPAQHAAAVVGTNERLDLRMRLAGMRAALRRVEAWADARDRGDRHGPFRRLIWQPVSEAVTRYRAQRNARVGQFLELLKTIEPTLKPGKIAAPELGDGVVFADRSALLHALLHTGNESNQRKLLLGYGWGQLHEDGTVDDSRWRAFLRRMHDEGRITKADWDFAQATWDLLEEMKPAAQKAHRSMFGHYFAEITAEPVQTPFGEYRGGYVPAITDRLLVPQARTQGAMDDMLASQNAPMFPAVNRGFTKGRIDTYAQPLALDLRLLPAHVDKVTRFSELGPALRDVARLVTRNKQFREAMNKVDPLAIESMLAPWLKRSATQTLNKAPETQADRAVARIATRVRNRTGLLLMAGNVVNTLQQVTGFSVAALRVNPGKMASGLAQLVMSPTSTARTINELSPWMSQRVDDSAREVDHVIERMLTNPSIRERTEQFGMRYGYALQQAAQNLMDRVIWLGAFKQATSAGTSTADAVREADSAVRMTQGSFAPEDAAKVEHAGAFTRLFLQFYSFFGGQANLLATEAQHAMHQSTASGRAARLAYVYALGFAVPALVADLIFRAFKGDLGGDDDDETLAEWMLKAFFMAQARYAMGMVPVAGQVGNAALGQLTPDRMDDRISASPAASALEATIRAPSSIMRAVEGEGDARMAVRDGLTAAAVLLGLPVGPFIRPFGYLASDDAETATPDEMARGLITGKQPKR